MCTTPSASDLSTRPDFSLSFPAEPHWVRTCRETVRTYVLGADSRPSGPSPELVELAVLLTSEAATNAVMASSRAGCACPITLHGEWLAGDTLRVHVQDAAPGIPALRGLGVDAEHGRGMHLISMLASHYGVCADGPGKGKSCWFQIGTELPPRPGLG